MLPDDHRLCSAPRLSLTQLHDETFIANPPSYHLRRLTEDLCRRAGFEPAIAIEITEFGSIVGLVGRGLGVALLPRGMAGDGVAEKSLTERVTRDVALVVGRPRVECSSIRSRLSWGRPCSPIP